VENISLHILDVVENSIRAEAKRIEISIYEDEDRDVMTIEIRDDGRGMNQEMLQKVLDPFTTTKSTSRVGLGLPLLAESARQSGGDLTIQSSPGKGTTVKADFRRSNIDIKPLGDMVSTLMALVIGNPYADFLYSHTKGAKHFCLDTSELKSQLDGLPMHHPDVVKMIRQYLQEGFDELGVIFY
jgi:anti-sigma regulatory factor (Ser/Thr protein kinase)